ncbi:hypothetical protein [Nocardioides sp. Leaf285]|uniref:hypothetical protein n=1 Tax=Nocardioides sp. Leaf285 TaxID=1736322 RepID=UPI000702F24D|nr:hypothetical protein [Nocardioides sp. Leaf285]KQP62889.1 hypothetical protein ASF47_17915 [Nocardioides sp. Leaf285]
MNAWATRDTSMLDLDLDLDAPPMSTRQGECAATALLHCLRRAVLDCTVAPGDFATMRAVRLARVAARHPEITWPASRRWLAQSLHPTLLDACAQDPAWRLLARETGQAAFGRAVPARVQTEEAV